jgi:hypothetical protein
MIEKSEKNYTPSLKKVLRGQVCDPRNITIDALICVDIDFNKGFPVEIELIAKD